MGGQTKTPKTTQTLSLKWATPSLSQLKASGFSSWAQRVSPKSLDKIKIKIWTAGWALPHPHALVNALIPTPARHQIFWRFEPPEGTRFFHLLNSWTFSQVSEKVKNKPSAAGEGIKTSPCPHNHTHPLPQPDPATLGLLQRGEFQLQVFMAVHKLHCKNLGTGRSLSVQHHESWWSIPSLLTDSRNRQSLAEVSSFASLC